MSIVREKIEPVPIRLSPDDGLVPNNPMPFLIYKGAVALDRAHPEQTIEKLFGANGWGAMWRNGVYDFLHYHATVAEVLGAGIARGHARALRRRQGQGVRDFGRRCRDPPRGHRASMSFGHPRLLRRRRLSAGTAHGSRAADAGKSCKGAEDDSRK